MGHQESYYRHNEAYAEFLSGWDAAFYSKYADTLRPENPGGRVLDVGCGVGQVVARLLSQGFEAHGVEVSEPNVQRARQISENCRLYDGRHLPYPDDYFDAAGALNVLEHVEQPEAFIAEVVRVVKPGGKVLLSSPNFFRALGFRDYHPKMRGLRNKWANWRRQKEKARQIREQPESVTFDRMTPIIKEPFTPDDDAIVATNGREIAFFLQRNGCEILKVECTDRYVPKLLDVLLNAGPWRYYMFNAFVLARKKTSAPASA